MGGARPADRGALTGRRAYFVARFRAHSLSR